VADGGFGGWVGETRASCSTARVQITHFLCFVVVRAAFSVWSDYVLSLWGDTSLRISGAQKEAVAVRSRRGKCTKVYV
jgi:hypothetical protein